MLTLPEATPPPLRAVLGALISGAGVYPDAATLGLALLSLSDDATADTVTYATAHALPSWEALEMMRRRLPEGSLLREVGAGTGLWTHVLRQALPGRTFLASENGAWTERYTTRWIDDLTDDDAASVAARYPGEPLLVIWPFGPMFAAMMDAMAPGTRFFHTGPWDRATNAPEFIAPQTSRLRVLDSAPLVPPTRGYRNDLTLYVRV